MYRNVLYEANTAASEFIPPDPKMNVALQGQQLVNSWVGNQFTLEDMRNAPALFTPNVSDINRQAIVAQSMQQSLPEVKQAAKNFANAKASFTHKNFK